MNHFIFVFLDGFGLGASENSNPLFSIGIQVLEKLSSGHKLVQGVSVDKPGVLIKGIDATLGVQGLPQSATGQTALFTGENASRVLGFHLPAFPNQRLVELIREHNILKKINDAGYRSTFANAYTDGYFVRARSGNDQHSVTTHCMLTAGLPFRTEKDLQENNAVYWDITREYLHHNNTQIIPIDPFFAGKHLADISRSYEFVLFECFATDIAGHKCDIFLIRKIFSILDSFFEGILKTKEGSANLLICSDHGNIEDLSVRSHTTNMVPLIVIGPDAHRFRSIDRINQVTPQILGCMNMRADHTAGSAVFA